MMGHRRPRVAPTAGQQGETLIELLATVILLGVGIIALLGALASAITQSSRTERATLADNEAVNTVEFIRAEDYIACADASSYGLPTSTHPNVTLAVTKVQRLQNAGSSNPVWLPDNAGCSAANDQGAQLITVRATATGEPKVNRFLTFVKRDRTCPDAASSTSPETC